MAEDNIIENKNEKTAEDNTIENEDKKETTKSENTPFLSVKNSEGKWVEISAICTKRGGEVYSVNGVHPEKDGKNPGNVQVVLEQCDGYTEFLDYVNAKTYENKTEILLLKSDISNLQSNIDKIKDPDIVGSLANQIKNLKNLINEDTGEIDLTAINDSISKLQIDIEGIKNSDIQYSLKTKITEIEEKISELATSSVITGLQDRITAVEEKLNNLKDNPNITELLNNLEENSNINEIISSKIAEIQEIKELSSSLNQIEQEFNKKINDNATNIGDIQIAINNIKDTISVLDKQEENNIFNSLSVLEGKFSNYVTTTAFSNLETNVGKIKPFKNLIDGSRYEPTSSTSDNQSTPTINFSGAVFGIETKAGEIAKALDGLDPDSDSYSSKYKEKIDKLNAVAGKNSFALGTGTIAKGEGSHAEGGPYKIKDEDNNEIITNTQAYGNYSHAEGIGTVAGKENSSSNNYSHSEGQCTLAEGSFSHAEGGGTKAYGSGSHAEGNDSMTNGHSSHAEGYSTITDGTYSHSEGSQTKARGQASHAEGRETIAIGYDSHAEGYKTQSVGPYSHSEGVVLTVNDTVGNPMDKPTRAMGIGSHAEGQFTQAGYAVTTTATDNTGQQKTTTNYYGTAAHAEGIGTYMTYPGGHAQGRYNKKEKPSNNDVENLKIIHVVGNGTDDSNRSNAYTLDKEGNGWYAGKVQATAIILTSSNGTHYEITVDDDGKLITTQTTDILQSDAVEDTSTEIEDENVDEPVEGTGE